MGRCRYTPWLRAATGYIKSQRIIPPPYPNNRGARALACCGELQFNVRATNDRQQ
jgi:hypothetical protein